MRDNPGALGFWRVRDELTDGRVPGFDSLYGLEFLALSDEEVRAQVVVADHHRQPFGLVHGGVLATMAESMASLGTWVGVRAAGATAAGLSNHASFLRPIAGGTVHAVARRRHRGATTWVWEVEITDDAGRLCALVRMTVAVRPPRERDAVAGTQRDAPAEPVPEPPTPARP